MKIVIQVVPRIWKRLKSIKLKRIIPSAADHTSATHNLSSLLLIVRYVWIYSSHVEMESSFYVSFLINVHRNDFYATEVASPTYFWYLRMHFHTHRCFLLPLQFPAKSFRRVQNFVGFEGHTERHYVRPTLKVATRRVLCIWMVCEHFNMKNELDRTFLLLSLLLRWSCTWNGFLMSFCVALCFICGFINCLPVHSANSCFVRKMLGRVAIFGCGSLFHSCQKSGMPWKWLSEMLMSISLSISVDNLMGCAQCSLRDDNLIC